MGGATFEPDVDVDVLGALDGDVFYEEADHAFAFPLGGACVVPQRREVGSEGHDPSALFVGEAGPVGVSCLFVVVLGGGELSQRFVPVGLEGVGHQAVVGIDGHVAPPCGVGVVSGPFDLAVA